MNGSDHFLDRIRPLIITEDAPYYSVQGKAGEQLLIEKALHNFEGDKTCAARFIGWTADVAEKMRVWHLAEGLLWAGEGWREAA